jgi:FkbM family methyltransferase
MLFRFVAERLYTALLNTYKREHHGNYGQQDDANGSLLHQSVQTLLHGLRNVLLRIADPVVTVRVHTLPLQMRLSHPNPLYAAVAPFYDTALPRICRHVRERDGWLQLVDVGANVGDTVAAVEAVVPESLYLCVEPNDDNVRLLRINTASYGKRLVCEQVLCGEQTGVVAGTLVENRGNSYLQTQTNSSPEAASALAPTMLVATLDDLVARHSAFTHINVVKIDTEGYDAQVLRGASQLISTKKPALYFEFIPDLLRAAGDEPLAVLDFLAAHGYESALIYDNKGIPLEVIQTSSHKALQILIERIDGKTVYYFDILAMHCDHDASFTAFVQAEFRTVIG